MRHGNLKILPVSQGLNLWQINRQKVCIWESDHTQYMNKILKIKKTKRENICIQITSQGTREQCIKQRPI